VLSTRCRIPDEKGIETVALPTCIGGPGKRDAGPAAVSAASM